MTGIIQVEAGELVGGTIPAVVGSGRRRARKRLHVGRCQLVSHAGGTLHSHDDDEDEDEEEITCDCPRIRLHTAISRGDITPDSPAHH